MCGTLGYEYKEIPAATILDRLNKAEAALSEERRKNEETRKALRECRDYFSHDVQCEDGNMYIDDCMACMIDFALKQDG